MPDNQFSFLAIDTDSPQEPLIQIYSKLKAAIIAGVWSPTECLPSAESIEDATDVDEYIIEEALEALTVEHWLKAEGDCFTITPKIDQPLASLSSLSDMLKGRGFTVESKWLKREVCQPNLKEKYNLCLGRGKAVTRFDRLRIAGDIVIGYELTSFPEVYLPKPQDIQTSLYSYMDEHDLHVVRATEEIEAFCCDEKMSELTGLPLGLPMLCLTRVGYMASGEPLEYTASYFQSQYYRYVVELHD